MGLKIKWLIFKKEKLNTQENDGLLILCVFGGYHPPPGDIYD